ncbi:MAG: hypothetical protein KGN34_00120 [Sphingomonadales bacterium]|nr:hypothetical protein [Sphingomonadales bacterium]
MEKKIRTELLKMTGIMLVLGGLGIYAHEFVIAGIMAKVALNSSIFAIFGVAAALAFKAVLALKNEVVALKALQVDYGQKHLRESDPYDKPAVVFHQPELLGQGYRLITEELARQDDLQLSSSDVQTLLHDVDARINDRKSTILYFSGLMVFLGLLGAFMGLMKTVHAVSDLIGAMDISGNAGADGFGKMIEGMKAPLAGMSVGFSSSLFGLMTSMVLGALERCMTSALKSLRNEFEHWLSHVTALDGGQAENTGHGGGTGELAAVRRALEGGAGHLREMRATMEAGERHTARLSAGLDGLNRATTRLADTVLAMTDPAELLRPVTETMTELGRNQIALLGQIRGLHVEAQADRAQMRAMLAAMDARIARSEALDGQELHRQIERLVALQTELAEREPAPVIVAVSRGRIATSPRIPRLFRALLGWLRVIQGDPAAARREARRLRCEVRAALGGYRRALRRQDGTISARFDRIEAEGRAGRDILVRLEQDAAARAAQRALLAERPNDDPAAGAFRDARMAMDLLQRRLNADVEPATDGDAAVTPRDAPPRRHGSPHS